jgi:hypothetical protein
MCAAPLQDCQPLRWRPHRSTDQRWLQPLPAFHLVRARTLCRFLLGAFHEYLCRQRKHIGMLIQPCFFACPGYSCTPPRLLALPVSPSIAYCCTDRPMYRLLFGFCRYRDSSGNLTPSPTKACVLLDQNQLTRPQDACFISCNSVLTCSYGGCCCQASTLCDDTICCAALIDRMSSHHYLYSTAPCSVAKAGEVAWGTSSRRKPAKKTPARSMGKRSKLTS